MLPLLGGFAILVGLLLLGYLFVNADPVRLARIVKWGGIALGGAAIIALLVLTEGRIFMFLAPLLAVLPALRRVRSMMSGFGGPSAARNSTVETPFIRMSLDHDTGAMSGTVLARPFRRDAARRAAPARTLGAACASAAPRTRRPRGSSKPISTGCAPTGTTRWPARRREPAPPPSSPDVTVEEAYAILGLAPGADAAAIKASHHRLMKQLHPDHGGTDYLAGKINRARDVLLKH